VSAAAWRNVAIALAVCCAVLWWRGRRPAPAAVSATPPAAALAMRDCDDPLDDSLEAERAREADAKREAEAEQALAADDEEGTAAFGVKIPDWVMWFAPAPGEDMLAYRDRLLPFARAIVLPHRARVKRAFDDFDAAAHLDAHQRAELDAAVDDAASAIQDRAMQGLMSGDLMPDRFKPSTAVTYAREVLDAVDGANQRFVASLTDAQREELAMRPFDFADYMLFSVHWEELIGISAE
jgi:hypothetical protein